MLETNRLFIRKTRPEDAKYLLDFMNSSFATKYNSYEPYNEVKLWRMAAKERDFVLIDKKTNKIIGLVGIEEDKHRYHTSSMSITYSLKEEYTKQGYMKEALREIIEYVFMDLDKSMISAYVFKENLASRHLLEGLGFHLDGILPLAFLRYDGMLFDECMYSMTKNEFEENLAF